MPLTLAVARESAEGESRTALSPETAKKFAALGARLRMEQSSGIQSHFLDSDYTDVDFMPVRWKPTLRLISFSASPRRVLARLLRCPKVPS